jgi:hypothetical protein
MYLTRVTGTAAGASNSANLSSWPLSIMPQNAIYGVIRLEPNTCRASEDSVSDDSP